MISASIWAAVKSSGYFSGKDISVLVPCEIMVGNCCTSSVTCRETSGMTPSRTKATKNKKNK